MNAIVAADIHGDLEAAVKLRNSLVGRDIDYIFLIGDYSRGFKDPQENTDDINKLMTIFSNYQLKMLPGNCDQKKSLEQFTTHQVNMHKAILKLPQVTVLGLGGSNPTPFNTPFELTEQEISQDLEDLFTTASADNIILLTHFPPKDTKCDQINGGAHVGSQALRQAIEKYQPKLALCSHIHESGGQEDRLGATKIFNLGRISEGRAYQLSLTSNPEIEFYTGK